MDKSAIKERREERMGGARQGAGRKNTGLKTVTVRMEPVLHELIKIEADRLGTTISEYVSRAIKALLQVNPLLNVPHHGSRSHSQIEGEKISDPRSVALKNLSVT